MRYTKHNFASGDTLLASDLNDMEDQIAANERTGIDLTSALNFYNNGAVPIVNSDVIPQKSYAASLKIKRYGNYLAVNGRRGTGIGYINVNTLNLITNDNYGTIDDFINTDETGYLYITMRGSIKHSSSGVTGSSFIVYCCEYTDEPSSAVSNMLAQVGSGNDVRYFNDGKVYKLRIPEHTNPIRIILYCRLDTWDCDMFFKFVSDTEMAAIQA